MASSISLNYARSPQDVQGGAQAARGANQDSEKSVGTHLVPLEEGKHQGRYDSGSKLVVPLSTASTTRVRLNAIGQDGQAATIILPRAEKAGAVCGLKFKRNDDGSFKVRVKYAGADGKTESFHAKVGRGQEMNLADLSANTGVGIEQSSKVASVSGKYESGIEGYGLSKAPQEFEALMVRTKAQIGASRIALSGADGKSGLLTAAGWSKQDTTDKIRDLLKKGDASPEALTDPERALFDEFKKIEVVNRTLNTAVKSAATESQVKAIAEVAATLACKSLSDEKRDAVVAAGARVLAAGDADKSAELSADAINIVEHSLLLAHAAFSDPTQAQCLASEMKFHFAKEDPDCDAKKLIGVGPQKRNLASLLDRNERMPSDLKEKILGSFSLSYPAAVLADLSKNAISFMDAVTRRAGPDRFDSTVGDESRKVVFDSEGRISSKEDLRFILESELLKRFASGKGLSREDAPKIADEKIVDHAQAVLDAIADKAWSQVHA